MKNQIRKTLLLTCTGLMLLFGTGAKQSSAEQPQLPENLISLPVVRQGTGYTCGVACVQSILYYNGIDFREDNLAQELGSTPEDGTNIDQMISFLTGVTSDDGWWLGLGNEFFNGIGAEKQEEMTLEELCEAIDESHPVICCLQAWYGESGYDYTDEWECGHYAIAIGYDETNIYFMDPSTLGNYTYIEKEEFLDRWHDKAGETVCSHMGIVITNPNPVFSSQQVLPME